MMQKDDSCFLTFPTFLCSFLTREGFECRDMIHCTVATLLSLNGDILIADQLQIHSGKETAVWCGMCPARSFIHHPGLYQHGHQLKGRSTQIRLARDVGQSGWFCFHGVDGTAPYQCKCVVKSSHWTCCSFSSAQR